MNNHSKPSSESEIGGQRIYPARTANSLGLNDQGDPSVFSRVGSTPESTGLNDYGEQGCWAPGEAGASQLSETAPQPSTDDVVSDEPLSGSVPVGFGIGSVTCIPVPGSGGLHIELSPRGYVPKSGCTSTLFVQDITGKRHLRLDYGYNTTTEKIEYIVARRVRTSYLKLPITRPPDAAVRHFTRAPSIFVLS